ncbi:MAG: hypothetical protein O3B01_29240 [Planctomycetota bacterium]|nr:hypothetical protein [Planctomycetota bacterium]MDA1142669.1 hypothetical protein [Planctomycetota bacterium]
MPLTGHPRLVARAFQDLGNRGFLAVHVSAFARSVRVALGPTEHVAAMRIPAGQSMARIGQQT